MLMSFQSSGLCFTPGQGQARSWVCWELDVHMVLPGDTSALDDECGYGLERVSRCTFLF